MLEMINSLVKILVGNFPGGNRLGGNYSGGNHLF